MSRSGTSDFAFSSERKCLTFLSHYAVYLSAVPFVHDDCTAIRLPSSPPAVAVWCFETIPSDLSCTVVALIQQRGARRIERLQHLALSSASYTHAWRTFATGYPRCPFSGAARLCVSPQQLPVAHLTFGPLHSKFTLASCAPGVASPVQRYI